MKRIFLFLLLALSLATSAQDIYSIAKPLRLGNVPVSESLADSVLVYTSGKMVRLVPRSEFGGSGGSQDLQQTLENGGTANIQITLIGKDGSTDYAIYDRAGMFLDDMAGLGRISNYYNGIIKFDDVINGGAISIASPNTFSNTTEYTFADKGGAHTIAAIDDITLQKALDNGATATAISNFSVAGTNGQISVNSNGAELSAQAWGALNINSTGIQLNNRGNSNPIILNGGTPGIQLNGHMGSWLKLKSDVVEFRSNQGMNIINQSSTPININNLGDKVNISGQSGIDLISGNGSIYLGAPMGINLGSSGDVKIVSNDTLRLETTNKLVQIGTQIKLKSSGAPNEIIVNDDTGSINIESQASGVKIKSTGGAVSITNTTGAGIALNTTAGPLNIESSGGVSVNSAGYTTISSAGINLTNNTGTGGQFLVDAGDVTISAGSGKTLGLFGYDLNIHNNNPIFFHPPKFPVTTVDNLPESPGFGKYATVTDAVAPTYLQPVVGGGTVSCPVFYDGTAWVAH